MRDFDETLTVNIDDTLSEKAITAVLDALRLDYDIEDDASFHNETERIMANSYLASKIDQARMDAEAGKGVKVPLADREIVYQPKASDDLKYWKRSGQKQIQQRILNLLQSIKDTPFEGIEKPEPLKLQWTGMWSRRIDGTHRIIYEIKNDEISVYSLKDHY